MSFIITYSKSHFDPIEPEPDKIRIKDIAHSLSLLCRANGHFNRFFSVAQHSLNCFQEAKARSYSRKIQLACLLHDASEAYLSDIIRPVKHHLPEYLKIEERLQTISWNCFLLEPLSEDDLRRVSAIDDAELYHEFQYFMDEQIFTTDPKLKAASDFGEYSFAETEERLLNAFHNLTTDDRNYCCVGIDGCHGKWVAVALHNGSYEAEKFDTIDKICKKYSKADSILIDIPIGLPENMQQDAMRPDKLLRERMKGKASSVFSVPCRQAVYEEDKGKAKKLNCAILGRSLSEQSLGICPLIRQVDSFLQQHQEWKNRLIESHPEYGFALLNNGKPVLESKRNPTGEKIRLDILSGYYPDTPFVIQSYLTAVPGRKKSDDVVDALCLAIMGKIGLEQGFVSLPILPEKDRTGLKMQIVTANL